MREIERQPAFRDDLGRLHRRGKKHKEFERFAALIQRLREDSLLPPAADDHPLRPPWQDFRSFKVQPDWLVYYRKEPGLLILARTGEHAYLGKMIPAKT